MGSRWYPHDLKSTCVIYVCVKGRVLQGGPKSLGNVGTMMKLNSMAFMATSTGAMKKRAGWLVYIGGYTTQLYRDYNKPL